MKDNIELVEKLVEKTCVSYTEAKIALEATDWDILEAIIKLEAEGKCIGRKTAEYSTQSAPCGETKSEGGSFNAESKAGSGGEEFKEGMSKLWNWIKGIFDKGNANSLCVSKNGEEKLSMPVTVFVLLMIIGFWIVIPLMIVGLFFGCKYYFSGAELGKDKINNAMGKASDVAEGIKNEIKNEMKAEKEKNAEEK